MVAFGDEASLAGQLKETGECRGEGPGTCKGRQPESMGSVSIETDC